MQADAARSLPGMGTVARTTQVTLELTLRFPMGLFCFGVQAPQRVNDVVEGDDLTARWPAQCRRGVDGACVRCPGGEDCALFVEGEIGVADHVRGRSNAEAGCKSDSRSKSLSMVGAEIRRDLAMMISSGPLGRSKEIGAATPQAPAWLAGTPEKIGEDFSRFKRVPA
jgi:hypothetical protein